MPSNQTPNYQLSQWEKSDKVLMDDFNADNAKIDAAIKAQADARTALAAQVAKKGNCRIWMGSYVGDGSCGFGHPTSFTFPQKPVAAFIIDGVEPRWVFPWNGAIVTTQTNIMKWNGNTISWHIEMPQESINPQQQLNYKGTTYRVIAFLAEDA